MFRTRFLNCEQFARLASSLVSTGELQIQPATMEKEWHKWMANVRTSEWCLSRQLWWGHRIPAYRLVSHQLPSEAHEWIVSRTEKHAKGVFAKKLGVGM